jgi:hypothetical protein
VKVNDYLEFPVDDLDMEPYMRESFMRRFIIDLNYIVFFFCFQKWVFETHIFLREKTMTAEKMFEMVRKKEVDLSVPEVAGPEKENSDNKKRPKGYYHYQLAGVVVHTGSIESGHYYSFIREREYENEKKNSPAESSSSSSSSSSQSDFTKSSSVKFRRASNSTWYCFNDSDVSTFDPNNIPDRCFGGMETKKEYDVITQQMKVCVYGII